MAMTRPVEVGQVSDLSDGAMKEIVAGGREILLARVQGRYYAIDNRCPHMGARLSQGRLEGSIITCPRHGSKFDVSDGHVVKWTAELPSVVSTLGKVFKHPRPVTTYKTTTEENRVFVEI